jgi:hypothetical protein
MLREIVNNTISGEFTSHTSLEDIRDCIFRCLGVSLHLMDDCNSVTVRSDVSGQHTKIGSISLSVCF